VSDRRAHGADATGTVTFRWTLANTREAIMSVSARAPLEPGEQPQNASQLRAAIDAGQMRDKINYPDPAVAPLGTDEEAGRNVPRAPELRRERASVPPAREAISDNLAYVLLAGPVVLALLLVAALAD
jgi:hypothetical protein